eukprot:4140989-Pleurochrysis_carterae.AAC.1
MRSSSTCSGCRSGSGSRKGADCHESAMSPTGSFTAKPRRESWYTDCKATQAPPMVRHLCEMSAKASQA